MSSPPGYASPVPSAASNTIESIGGDSQTQAERLLRAQDELRKHYPDNEHVPVPTLCVLGAQNAGKSSALSGLMNIELYSAERIATHGPTLIASRRSRESFCAFVKIIVHNVVSAKRIEYDFAHSIRNPKDLAAIIRSAGDEARRANQGEREVRTWEQLKTMPPSQILDGMDDWVAFTENVVTVSVSGPTCVSVDLTDLPGLIGGKDRELVEALVEQYIGKPHNVIVLCITGGGNNDPSSTLREIELAVKHDPTGGRTLGIITRADDIDPDIKNGSAIVDVILGKHQNLGDFHPSLEWWPLRLRTKKERQSNETHNDLYMKQKALFQSPEWLLLQKVAGREFGLSATRKQLEAVFVKLLTDNAIQNKRRLLEIETENRQWIEQHPEPSNPIGAFHDLIGEFAMKLETEVKYSNRRQSLFQMQENFGKAIFQNMPDFVPFDQVDAVQDEISIPSASFYQTQGLSLENRDKIYLNQFAEAVERLRNKRDPDSIENDLIPEYLRTYVPRWRATAIRHVTGLWSEVETIQRRVACELSGSNHGLANGILEHMIVLNLDYKDSSLRSIEEMYRLAMGSPSEISFYDKTTSEMRTKACDFFGGQYNLHISSQTSISAFNEGIPSVTQDTLSAKDLDTLFSLQSKILAAIWFKAHLFVDVVGGHAQLMVLDHVKSAISRLRQGFGLENLEGKTRKRIIERLEPDMAVRQERDRRVKQKKDYAKIHEILNDVGL